MRSSKTSVIMTEIAGKIAFPNSSIPAHVDLSPDPGATFPIMALSGPITHDDGEIALVLTGQPRLGGTTDPDRKSVV